MKETLARKEIMTFDLFIMGVVASFGIYIASIIILLCMNTPFVKLNIGRWFLGGLLLLWTGIIMRATMHAEITLLCETATKAFKHTMRSLLHIFLYS
ncbi:MAG: hypothetical protein A2494_00515 [Candidatus Lloydbacteria bacterium RIFOXYC12_FULL_46_25]|uniref:Uncharacterized protein n=1 Tax=Candidatus Lloydbacteria bacterium RIFOXYC12_FULL_46_25 TaxID=1798670 RepID=A0A1G2DSI1_9BACT|nr:MAG: hypothetical protein A2494_00515 [Candidatus Lloydbacteria bacterium RIFOXYC12_FULL_46_25]